MTDNKSAKINETINNIQKQQHVDNPNNKNKTDTNISDNYKYSDTYNVRDNIYTPLTYNKKINNTITICCFLYWIFIVTYLYKILEDNKLHDNFSLKSRLYFLPFFLLIVLYPILYFVNQFIHTNLGNRSKTGKLTNIDPSYPVCNKMYTDLTEEEKNIGAVGKVDYKCHKNIVDFNKNYGDIIIRRTYYIIHAIFALILFLFTQRAGKFKNTVASSDSKFITILIQQALFLAIILLSCSVILKSSYLSTFILLFFMNLLQLLGALTIMLVAFILYRLIYLFV